ncbi:MAG: hypothetical protein ACK53L_32545, partial [Pirellulaceae bacterium]
HAVVTVGTVLLCQPTNRTPRQTEAAIAGKTSLRLEFGILLQAGLRRIVASGPNYSLSKNWRFPTPADGKHESFIPLAGRWGRRFSCQWLFASP